MSTLMVSAWRGGTPRRLSRALGIPYVSLDRLTRARFRQANLIVNWGSGRVFDSGPRVLNFPSSVAQAANKLSCFQALDRAKVPTLEWTRSLGDAAKWLVDSSVVGHFDLHGHSGSGLRLYRKGETLGDDNAGDVKLFTKYFPKEVESRVLLIRRPGGENLFTSMYMEKVRVAKEKWAERGLTESPTTFIRTWTNGWNFARSVSPDAAAVEWASRALGALKLDYGAVDLMRDKTGKRYIVGEINTAPGLEGLSLSFFQTGLTRLMRSADYR